MEKLVAKEIENGKIMRDFAKKIILLGANIESAEYVTIEPMIIFNMYGTRFSITGFDKNVFANASLESNDFTIIIETDDTLSDFLKQVLSKLELLEYSNKQTEWFTKFDNYIVTLKKHFDVTPVMEQLACDVAWDMTEGWDNMVLEDVANYLVYPNEFIEALKHGEKVMRSELDIDFNDTDEVCDNSNDYSFGVVEDKFFELVKEMEVA